MSPEQKDIKRFWKKVLVYGENHCWEFQGCKLKNGYGRISINGKVELAHRVSWKISNNEIPEGMCILHKCDNRICVNPNHLFIGTKKDNAEDRDKKGRQASRKGELNGRSVLTKDQVEKIKSFPTGFGYCNELAKRFNVNKQVIFKIKHGKTWR